MKIIHKNKKHYLLAICEDGKCEVQYTDRNLAFEAWHEHNDNDDILFWKDNCYWKAWSVKTNKVGNNVSLIQLLSRFGQPKIPYVN